MILNKDCDFENAKYVLQEIVEFSCEQMLYI